MTTTMGQDESNGTSAPQGIGCPIDTADAVATPCRLSAGHCGEGWVWPDDESYHPAPTTGVQEGALPLRGKF